MSQGKLSATNICIASKGITNSTQNLHGKSGQQSPICWNSLGLFSDNGQNYISFLFFKIESWKFQHLFEKELHETSLIQFIKTISISIFFYTLKSDWVEILFTKFFFKQMLKILAFYLKKQNSFIPKKNII